MATLMILSKSRPCESARPLIWRMCKPMAIKISALLGALAILLLPVVSCGWLSGDAFGNFDLAEQCNRLEHLDFHSP